MTPWLTLSSVSVHYSCEESWADDKAMITHHAMGWLCVRLTVSVCHHVWGIPHDPASQTHHGRHASRHQMEWAQLITSQFSAEVPYNSGLLCFINSSRQWRRPAGSHIKLRSNLQQPLSSKLYWDKIVNVQNGQLSSHSNILIFKQFNWQTNCKWWYAFFSRDWWELIENWSEILELSVHKSVSM